MTEKISIIVPAYNAEKFISKCIRSVRGQSYKNLEMIIVDDGSRDRTLDICHRFEKKDGRIRIFSRENSGASSARNFGIDMSEGEYILFLDSDDWLPKDALKDLREALSEREAQLSVGSLKCVSARKPLYISSKNEIIDKRDTYRFCNCIINDKPISYMAAKLFFTDIIKKNGIRFQEDMKVSEDSCFVLEYLKHVDRIAGIDSTVYYYNRLLDSSVSQRFYSNRMDWIITKFGLQVELVGDGIASKEIQKLYADEFKNVFVWCMLHYMQNIPDKEELTAILTAVSDKLLRCPRLAFLLDCEDGDGLFKLLRDGSAEALYDFIKSRERVVTVNRTARIKRRVWSAIGKIKAWFIFNF